MYTPVSPACLVVVVVVHLRGLPTLHTWHFLMHARSASRTMPLGVNWQVTGNQVKGPTLIFCMRGVLGHHKPTLIFCVSRVLGHHTPCRAHGSSAWHSVVPVLGSSAVCGVSRVRRDSVYHRRHTACVSPAVCPKATLHFRHSSIQG